MSRFVCACGEVSDLSRYPSVNESWLLSTVDFDSALSAAANQLASGSTDSLGVDYPADSSVEERAHDLFSDRLLEQARGVVVCNSCGDLWIQHEPDSAEYNRFSPASPRSSSGP